MKPTKKQKNLLIGILILAGIILIAYFGFRPFSIFSPAKFNVNPASHSTSLYTQDSVSATYRFTITGWAGEQYGCSQYTAMPVDLTINNIRTDINMKFLPAFISGLQEGKEFKARSVSFTGINAVANPCSDLSKPSTITQDLTAYCSIRKADDIYMQDPNRAVITCKVTGMIMAQEPSNIYWGGSLEILPVFYKQGIECVNNEDCNVDFKCQSNVCVQDLKTYYRLQNNQCFSVQLLASQKTINDYTTLSECQDNIDIEPPVKPEPKGFFGWLSRLNEWITDFFRRIGQVFGLTITGPTIVEPNTQHTYEIDLSAPIPDSNWEDGAYSVQYGVWGIVDSDNNVLQEGVPEEINGAYKKSVTITTPSKIGDYALIGLITQYDGIFNTTKKSLGLCTGKDCWDYTEEYVVNKEAIGLETEYSITEPEVPVPGGFQKFINKIIDWIKKAWDLIFG